MGKRYDKKHRLLKTGESGRPDGYYQYRYTDRKGKRHKEEITILIRRKQLNVNDEVVIRKLNEELYIGKYKVSEEQS